jgi:hypothetical protein
LRAPKSAPENKKNINSKAQPLGLPPPTNHCRNQTQQWCRTNSELPRQLVSAYAMNKDLSWKHNIESVSTVHRVSANTVCLVPDSVGSGGALPGAAAPVHTTPE